MATPHQFSSPSSAQDNDIAQLRHMYKRYMLIPSVAQWLLSREAHTDFHAVRREKSVMVSISSASPPQVIPHHSRDVPIIPFPASSDLMFLDHVQDGFALGHTWGNIQNNGHPYAPQAARAGKSGWNHVQSRKFASDVTADGVLEVVEYTWFTDNRAMVILSRVPCRLGQRAVRTAEVLFFDSVERNDMPPQRPALVLLVHDRSMCTTCGKEICCCPNAIGIDRAAPLGCIDLQASTHSAGGGVSKARLQSWQDRTRIVSHGTKRGMLSIVYNGSFSGNFSQITVRQAYASRCEDQDTIGYRIQQHLTKLLSQMPPVGSSVIDRPVPSIAAIPPFGATQDCGIASTPKGFSHSPLGFTRKEGNWFEASRRGTRPPFQENSLSSRGKEKQGCCTNTPKYGKLDKVCGTMGGSSCGRKAEPDTDSERPGSGRALREEHVSEKGSRSGTPDVTNSHEAIGEEQEDFRNSLCGPEKAGTDCDCSAEKMQDPSLARILNSGADQIVSHRVEDMSSFIEPNFASSPTEKSNLLQSISEMNPTALLEDMPRQEQRQLSSGQNPYDNQSPDSTKCGTSTTLPSPLAPQLSVQMEPMLKRRKVDSFLKPEPLRFGLEAGWQGSLEDRDKILPLANWNGAGGSIDRPLSALGLAIGGSRSHSPFAMMSSLAKTPSPPTLPSGGNVFPYGKAGQTDFDFNSPFDSLVSRNLPEIGKGSDGRMDLGSRGGYESIPSIQLKSPVAPPRGTGIAPENAGANGVCCDICGITFAKRSNKIRHIQTVHNRVKQFKCDLCGSKFGLKADLGRHRFRIHESRAFRCDSCGKSFAEHVQLEHHIRVTHEEDSRRWECKTCRMRFGRKSSLTRHEQTVHQQTRFVCRFCKKSYSQKFDAVRHERRVHGVDDTAGSAGIRQVGGT